ncbi:unnamed protein product, partial [Choristocarpus tenellus]
MRVCDQQRRTGEVPGTSGVGKMGVTFTYPQAPERTRPVGVFFRDKEVSSTDSVLVRVALALDTPITTPIVLAWEREGSCPESAPDEDVLGIVPGAMISAGAVLWEGVESGLGSRTIPSTLVLTAAERPPDYCNSLISDVTLTRNRENPAKGIQHLRMLPQVDDMHFRRYAVYHLLEPDPVLQTLAFGVTERAALPNTARVCGRSTFHSEQRCVEQLCRQQRTAKDYAYVTTNKNNRGFNEPHCFSVYCSHEKQRLLRCTGLQQYIEEMDRVAKEREKLAKEEALQAKIEVGKARRAERRARDEAEARLMAKKTEAKSLKLLAGPTRRRKKWEARLKLSVVQETRGCWEQRQDSGGSLFFHCTDEFIPEPFSWDPPPDWDAELLPTSLLSEGGHQGEGTSHTQTASSSVWAASSGGEGSSAYGGFSSGMGQGATTTLSTALPSQPLPVEFTEEERLRVAVQRLAENEQLLEALAWRLGIPQKDVRRDGREPPLARNGAEAGDTSESQGEDDSEEDGNRGEIEVRARGEVMWSNRRRGN